VKQNVIKVIYYYKGFRKNSNLAVEDSVVIFMISGNGKLHGVQSITNQNGTVPQREVITVSAQYKIDNAVAEMIQSVSSEGMLKAPG
jgi:hypothetical protein